MLLSKKRSRRSGAAIVEFTVVAIVAVILIFGILEFCWVVYTYNVVENAAREGCRYGIVNVLDTTMVADTQKVTKEFMGGLDTSMKKYNCDVYLADATGKNIGSAKDAQFSQHVCVEVSLDYTPLTPGLGWLKTFTIRSKCSMGSEAN
jgi:Flp pilus assembly protein TadG